MTERARFAPVWRGAGGLICALALLALTGCQGAIVGSWRMIEVKPSRQVFCIDRATFRGNGTYEATTVLEGRQLEESGTYEFNGFSLKLRPTAGGQRTYSTTLKLDRLEVLNGKKAVVLQKTGQGG